MNTQIFNKFDDGMSHGVKWLADRAFEFIGWNRFKLARFCMTASVFGLLCIYTLMCANFPKNMSLIETVLVVFVGSALFLGVLADYHKSLLLYLDKQAKFENKQQIDLEESIPTDSMMAYQQYRGLNSFIFFSLTVFIILFAVVTRTYEAIQILVSIFPIAILGIVANHLTNQYHNNDN